jgi:uncharacterized protein
MAMLYLDTEDIDEQRFWPWLLSSKPFCLYRILRKDYHQPNIPSLKAAVLTTYSELTQASLVGDEKVYLLTQARMMGYSFNPVSFYYIFNATGKIWLGVLAEINNTPWNERFCYAHTVNDSGSVSANFQKKFHVSPFMPMDQQYSWIYERPEQSLEIDMSTTDPNHGKIFNAHMSLKQKTLTKRNLIVTFFSYPLTPLVTTCAIYWHALRLRLKGNTYFSHPQNLEKSHAP